MFLGGSLTPLLLEPACDIVVSVDERGRQQPDERGEKYDYAGIAFQSMVSSLISHGIGISKLVVHDGAISAFDQAGRKFDLAFIGGERTDVACVRDFAWLYPMMKEDSIIPFHDSIFTKDFQLCGS